MQSLNEFKVKRIKVAHILNRLVRRPSNEDIIVVVVVVVAAEAESRSSQEHTSHVIILIRFKFNSISRETDWVHKKWTQIYAFPTEIF